MEHLTARRRGGGREEDEGLRAFVDVAGKLRAHDHRRIMGAVGAVGAEGAVGWVRFHAGATVANGGVEAAAHEVVPGAGLYGERAYDVHVDAASALDSTPMDARRLPVMPVAPHSVSGYFGIRAAVYGWKVHLLLIELVARAGEVRRITSHVKNGRDDEHR